MQLGTEFLNPNRIALLEQIPERTLKVQQFLSESEVSELESLEKKAPHREYRRYGANVSPGQEANRIFDMVREKVTIHLGRFNPNLEHIGLSFYSSSETMPPHSDNPRDPNVICTQQFLVPISFIGPGKSGSVVLFQQKFYGPSNHPLFSVPEQQSDLERWNLNRKKYFKNYLEGSNAKMAATDEIFQDLETDLLSGLSQNSQISYKLGDLVLFDAPRIHCAGSLSFHHLESKILLLGRVYRKVNG